VLRAFGAHRTGVRCVDCHPYGDFFATGSADFQVKTWDIRQKKHTATMKGHSAAITVVKHSPDGRWLVSGDAAGAFKIWDLTKIARGGRTVMSDDVCESPSETDISAIEFDPASQSLATAYGGGAGGGDKRIAFWDLSDAQELVKIDTTPKEASRIRTILFHGGYLFSGSDSLKVRTHPTPDTGSVPLLVPSGALLSCRVITGLCVGGHCVVLPVLRRGLWTLFSCMRRQRSGGAKTRRWSE
jgi:katanin p80 WD40 repeat-containing subunit B1